MERKMAAAQAAQQQTQDWRGKSIDSRNAVYDALEYLQLPRPSPDAFTLISSGSGRGKFKNALEECVRVTGKEPSQEAKRYLTGLMRCVSETCIQTVTGYLGYKNIPLEAFVLVGQENGMAFYTAVRATRVATDDNHSTSFAVVHELLKYAVEKLGGTMDESEPRQPKAPSELPSASRFARLSAKSTDQSESEAPMACNSEDEEGKKGDFYSAHAYGGKAAVCFNATESTRENFCVIVDGAVATGERVYDWKNAIKIQLGHKELPILYGVLVGWRNSVKFDAHGTAHDKTFEIERQKDKFFIKISAKGQALRAIPVGSMDIYPIMNLVLSQIIKEAPKEFRGHPDIVIRQMKAAQHIDVVAAN